MAKISPEMKKERMMLLDNSTLNVSGYPGLATMLYSGVEGLEGIDGSIIAREHIRTLKILELADEGDLRAISESVIEIETLINTVNEQLNYINSNYFNRRKSKGGRKHRKRRIKLKDSWNDSTSEDIETQRAKLEEIKSLINGKYRILKRVENTDPRELFEERDKQTYDFTLQSLKKIKSSIDLTSYGDIHKREISHPTGLGDAMETDEKIIATAFSFSRTIPVTIITRDAGLVYLAQKLGVKNPEEIRLSQGVDAFNMELNDASLARKDIYAPGRIILPQEPDYSSCLEDFRRHNLFAK